MGLVKQCVTSLYKKNIQRLTKVSGQVVCDSLIISSTQRPVYWQDVVDLLRTRNCKLYQTLLAKQLCWLVLIYKYCWGY